MCSFAVSGAIVFIEKVSCAIKIVSGIYSAFDSSMLALNHKYLKGVESIIASDIDKTIKTFVFYL